MTLINGSGFLSLCQAYRICWISGRFGGGKTSLAYRVAYDLVRYSGYRYVISNIKDIWSEKLSDIVLRDDLVDSVVILDEGGVFLKYGRDVEEYMTLLRKLNIVVLIPSVMPPSNRIRFFRVKRTFNLNRIGLPVWVYKWSISDGFETFSEVFYWWNPQEIFGVYDTKAPPIDDGGVSKWLSKIKTENRERTGYTSVATVDEGDKVDEGEQSLDVLEASENISNSVSLYAESLSKRRH